MSPLPPHHHTGFASSLAVSQYLKAAPAYGIDPGLLLARHQIDPERLDDIDYRIPLWRLEALVADLLAQSGDPLFGLHTAQKVDLGTYNVLGYISNHVSCLREMCEIIPAYEQIFGDIGTTHLGIGPHHSHLRWTCQLWDPEVARHVAENTLGSWYGFVKQIIRMGVRPQKVSFTHGPPSDPGAIRALEAHFDCQISFGEAQNSIWIDSAHLDLANPNADPKLLATLLRFADDLLAKINRNLSSADRVRRALKAADPGRGQNREAVARSLGMSGRSLHRRLEQEGTGFQQLLDEARFEAATRALCTSDLPVSHIASELGYDEVRSFYRRFKAWSGMTVGAFRKKYQTTAPLPRRGWPHPRRNTNTAACAKRFGKGIV
ncbi:MAG: AraC family transcriptional regulator [Mangrovicoccus sp.]|nr:AraC family transcriptional regulator [Mangrovicoccus sp.]